MNDEEARLLELASRLSDGQEIDWEAQSSGTSSPDEQLLLEELRTLDSLACFHRKFSESRLEDAEDPTTWAELEILERIGSGSFGDVFLAWDPRLEREVALKLRRAEGDSSSSTRSILREGRILARLKHPNVATVHGAAEEDGRVGVWMELIRGRTLAEIVEDQGPLAAREAAGIGVDVCRAVAAVHREGLLHRDIKAQNVMRERGGRIVLMDFGLGSRPPRAGADQPSLSGTPLYMAPEVLSGGPASVQSDIYAIGVLLFHLVTGSYPVAGKSLSDLTERHVTEDYFLLRDVRPGLPGAFSRVVERALSSRPEDRFQTVGEMEQALDRALTSARSRDWDVSTARPQSRRWLWGGALGLLLALLAVLAGWNSWFGTGAARDPRAIPIAVINFDNFTGDMELDWLRQGIPDQLIYNLSRSAYLQVRSMDRVLENLGARGDGLSQKARMRDLAERANAAYMVGGSVFLEDGRLTIISQITDLASDRVLDSPKVAGAGADELFDMLGELSHGIRGALEIESEESPEIKEGVARLKTASKDAYKAYVQCRQRLHGRSYQEALAHCRDAVGEDPDFLHAWDLLANVYDNLGERELALEALDNATPLLARVPRVDQLTVLQRQAQLRENWNDYQAHLQELQLLQPGEPTWPFRLGWSYATHVRDYDLAIREYRQALDKGAEPRTHLYLCYAYLSAADYPSAEEACGRFVQEWPREAAAHDGLGFVYMLRGEYEAARREFETALELEPDFSHSLQNLGELELLLGRLPQAREYFDRYLVQAIGEKQEKEGRWSLGRFHWELGRLEEARRAAAAALRQDEGMVKGLWLLGLIQVEEGDLAGARQTLAKIERRFSDSSSLREAEFQHHLASRLAEAEGRFGDAVAEMSRALQLRPSERPFFLVALASARRAAGDLEGAADSCREALSLNPRFPDAHLLLAGMAEQRGQLAEAIEHAGRALSIYEGASADFPRRRHAEEMLRRAGGR